MNAALCPKYGSLSFYRIGGGSHVLKRLPDYATQVASLDKNHLLKMRERLRQKSGGLDISNHIVESQVKCETFDRLQQKYGTFLDDLTLVVIDAEGHDGKLVEQLLLSKFCAKVIMYEDAHLSVEEKLHVKTLLLDNGYAVFRQSKMDSVAF
eukprot:gene29534-36793_t